MDERILQQFPLLEETLAALGVVVWPMVDLEADDALGAAAVTCAAADSVRQVLICSPDKDLTQCVRDERVVVLDRRANTVSNEQAVIARFGVPPRSIPDYLALVGDSADGFPGLPGWGKTSTAAVLSRFGHLEQIPLETPWNIGLRGEDKLRDVLREKMELALLFRDLATLRSETPILGSPDELLWKGPTAQFPHVCEVLDARGFIARADQLAAARASVR